MESSPEPDFLAVLAVLQEHGVDFIVVGGEKDRAALPVLRRTLEEKKRT